MPDSHEASPPFASTSTGQLAAGTEAGITSKYCIRVGSFDKDGNLIEGTGDVKLNGSMSSGAYILIGGDLDMTGKLSQKGEDNAHRIEIGGNASIGGTLTSDKKVTIGGTATLGGNATAGGELAVGGSLTGTNTEKNISVKASSMNLGGNVSHVDLEAATISFADGATLDSVGVKVAATALSLKNVEVRGKSDFQSSGGVLTLNAEGVTFVLDESTCTWGAVEPSAVDADPLMRTKVSGGVFYIDSTMLGGVNLSGSMTLDLSAWASQIASGGYESVVLEFADGMTFATNATVQATFDGGTTFVQADLVDGNMTQFNTRAIPEPTTATLSLLALASLMARRRRR